MIVEWFMELWTGLVEWFAALLPSDDPPEFLTNIAGFLDDLLASAAGLGAWVPWSYLGVLGGSLLLMWVIFVGIKGIRWLWGLTPFSGGS